MYQTIAISCVIFMIYLVIDWLIDCCLMSTEQYMYFSYIHDKNIWLNMPYTSKINVHHVLLQIPKWDSLCK